MDPAPAYPPRGLSGLDDLRVFAPAERPRARRELLAMMAARERVGAGTSWIGIAMQAWFLSRHASLWLVGMWACLVLTFEATNWALSCRIERTLDDEAHRRRLTWMLRASVAGVGTSWGCSALMLPDLAAGNSLFNLVVLAAVALTSVHNLSYDRLCLVLFVTGLGAATVLRGLITEHDLGTVMAMAWVALTAVVLIYAQATRGLFLSDLQSRLALEGLSTELRDKNASLERALSTIEALARIDPLTGALNRRAGMEALDREARAAARSGGLLGLLMIDLDHFKQINDTRGHVAGDAVLVEVESRLREGIRATDHLARWGGEEFLVLLCRTDGQGLSEVAQRLRQAIADRPVRIDGTPLSVTASMGLAVAPRGSIEAGLKLADEALYEAKRAGRNLVVVSHEASPLTHVQEVS